MNTAREIISSLLRNYIGQGLDLPKEFLITFIITDVLFIFFIFLFVKRNDRLRELSRKHEEHARQLKHRLYELKFMEELDERFGYSLDVENVLDTVFGSIGNLISYSTVSYAYLEGNKLKFKCQLAEEVSEKFVEEVKKNVTDGLSALVQEDLGNRKFEQVISGSIIDDMNTAKVGSYFNIPLEVGNRAVGMFNVSYIVEKSYQQLEIKLLYRILGKATNTVSRLQSLLERERGKLEAVVESMTDGVLMIDKDFRILVVNPAFLSMLGIKEDDNLNIFDIVGSFGKSFPIEEKIAQVFERGEPQSVSQVHLGDKYLQIISLPVNIRDGEVGVGLLIHDESERMKLDQLKEDFTAMMVHELRSPLTVITGISDLLLKEAKNLNKDKIDTLLGQVNSSSSGLLDIVNDLLDVARMESDKFEIKKEPTNLNKILGEEADSYKRLAKDKGLELTLKGDESIGDVNLDGGKIKQVMNNLLSNAIKFTSSGDIKIMSKKVDNAIQVSVADTGRGIPDSFKPKLFNKFTQFRESSLDAQRGTGLGLVVAKGIVKGHGGKIWAEDNKPGGTVFTFTLPLSESEVLAA